MGAALIAKAVRVTLTHRSLTHTDCIALEAALDLARDRQLVLTQLAADDQAAYRAVLDLRAEAAEAEAWRTATEVPIHVAEACHPLLIKLPSLLDLCWPVVRPDLEIGGWLLQAGLRAGLLAAESNLREWGDNAESQLLRARIEALSTYRKGGKDAARLSRNHIHQRRQT